MHTSSSTFFMQKNQCECIIVSFFYSLLFCCLAQHWTQQQSSKCIFAYLFPLRLSSYFVFSAFAFIVALKASFSVDSMLSFSVYLLPIVGNIIFLLDFCYCLHKMRVFFFYSEVEHSFHKATTRKKETNNNNINTEREEPSGTKFVWWLKNLHPNKLQTQNCCRLMVFQQIIFFFHIHSFCCTPCAHYIRHAPRTCWWSSHN